MHIICTATVQWFATSTLDFQELFNILSTLSQPDTFSHQSQDKSSTTLHTPEHDLVPLMHCKALCLFSVDANY